MTTQENRPGVGSRAALEAFRGATQSLADAAVAGIATRTRCVDCGHILQAERSVARGRGPVCWSRAYLAHADDRRQALRARLAALDALVAELDTYALALVAAGIEDVLEALVDRGVAL